MTAEPWARQSATQRASALPTASSDRSGVNKARQAIPQPLSRRKGKRGGGLERRAPFPAGPSSAIRGTGADAWNRRWTGVGARRTRLHGQRGQPRGAHVGGHRKTQRPRSGARSGRAPEVHPGRQRRSVTAVPIPGLPRSGTRNAPKRTDTRPGHRPRPASASDPRGSSPPLHIRAAAARRQVVCKLPERCRTARWPLSRSRERKPLSAIGNRRRKPEPARASWEFGARWHGPWNRRSSPVSPHARRSRLPELHPCPKSTPSSSSTTRSTS